MLSRVEEAGITVDSFAPDTPWDAGAQDKMWGRKKEPEIPAPAVTISPEQNAYLEARASAKRRVRFFGHVVVWAMSVLFLLVTGGFEPAIVVAVGWGIFLATQGYYAIIAPELTRRFVEEEVSWRLRAGVEKERRAIESRHSRSLEDLSASIAHEIRNPITAAKSLVQQMGEDANAAENIEYAKIALEELDRVERSVSHLLRYARDEDLRVQPTDAKEIVDSALETFRDRLSQGSVDIERDLERTQNVRADPEKLRRVVINLIGNALDAMDEASTPQKRIRISCGRNLAGDEFWLRVADNGPGIAADRLPKIWNPFHTSKSGGTGLGLAVSKKMVEAHGGSIEVSSSPENGTEFVVTLPQSPERGAET